MQERMTQELWTAVDEYLSGLLVPDDPMLDATLAASTTAGLPAINVAPNQGKLLYLLARMNGARANIDRAGLADVVDVRVGKALDTLPELAAQGSGPFDLIFIDADKSNIPEYFRWALELSHVKTVIIVDNVIRDGAVINETSTDMSVQGVRRLYELIGSSQSVTATAIQTVGAKGYDGFAMVLVACAIDNVD